MFIDGFSRLFSGEKQEKLDTITVDVKTPIISTLTQCILKALGTQKGKPTMFIEGLDFLLAATNISPNDLLGLLSNMSTVPIPLLHDYISGVLIPAYIAPLHFSIRRPQSAQFRNLVIEKPRNIINESDSSVVSGN